MINVSDNYKEAVKSPIRRLYAQFSDGVDTITANDDLKGLKLSIFGDIGKAIMRQCEVSYFGTHSFVSGEPSFGVYVENVLDKGEFTVTIASPAIVTLNNHGLITGNRVKLSTTGALPTGLVVDTYYFVIKVNSNTFKLATTYDNAMNNIAIATSGTQSGVHSLSYYEDGIGDNFEKIDLGTFYVKKTSVDVKSELTTITLYDKMYEALINYTAMVITPPLTLKQYLQAICNDLDWTLGTTTFTNDDMVVDYDLFAMQGKTYRDILNQIAEASGTIMYFNNKDELILKSVGGSSVEEIVASNLYSIDTELKWGEVNSIVFRSNPIETNWVWWGGYYHKPLLLENGYPVLLGSDYKLRTEQLAVRDDLYQIRIDNNFFIAQDQEAFMPNLVTVLMGYSFIPFEAKTTGLGYFEVGDTITLTDHNGVSYETSIFNIELEVSVDGFRETLSAEKLELGITNKKEEVGIIEQTVQKTIITGENLEDNSVPAIKIKEITADKIRTGYLQVGVAIIIPDDVGDPVVYIANEE